MTLAGGRKNHGGFVPGLSLPGGVNVGACLVGRWQLNALVAVDLRVPVDLSGFSFVLEKWCTLTPPTGYVLPESSLLVDGLSDIRIYGLGGRCRSTTI